MLWFSAAKRLWQTLSAGVKPLDETQTRHINEVTRVFDALTLSERSTFFNGFGSQLPGLNFFTRVIPKDLREAFLPAADWHDCAYIMGGCDYHRRAADAHFLKLMCNVALGLPVDQMFRAFGWALVAWKGVAVGGGLSWEYRDYPLTLEQVQKRARGVMYG